MSNIELQRTHLGTVQLTVDGMPALGAKFTGIQSIEGEQCAVIVVPLKDVTFAEARNVVPFVRAA